MKSENVSRPEFRQSLLDLADGIITARRRSLPSVWGSKHIRVDESPLGFADYPWQKAILDDPAPRLLIMKAAQLGLSLSMTVLVLWAMDELKVNALYLLPTAGDVRDYSSFRFDALLQSSPYMRAMFHGKDSVSNLTHKKAGAVNLFCRGARSRTQLKTIPPGILVLDEYDEMGEIKDTRQGVVSAIEMARERLSGHKDKIERDLSTPSVAGYGIAEEFEETSKQFWFVPCGACDTKQRLTWEDNVRWEEGKTSTATMFCSHCKQPWTEVQRLHAIRQGEWVAEHPDAEIPGYHISQLYSPTMNAKEIVDAWIKVRDNEARKQVFYNSKLGLPYVATGAQLTRAQLDACLTTLQPRDASVGSTMGIDVSQDRAHYAEISEWKGGHKIVLNVLRPTWDELPGIMNQYGVRCCVIDANPERYKAREFAERFDQRVFMAWYPRDTKALYELQELKLRVNIHRTESLDFTMRRIKEGAVSFPSGLTHWEEYCAQLCAPVKNFKEDAITGQPIGRYVEGGKADHFAHAANYNEIAGRITPVGAGVGMRVYPGAAQWR